MKAAVFNEKVKNICMCIRGDRAWTPLAAAHNYLGGAKRALKYARPIGSKRLIKDIKRDIKVTQRIISELEHSNDLQQIEKKLRRQAEC